MMLRLFVLCLACIAAGTSITSIIAFPRQAPFWAMLLILSVAAAAILAGFIVRFHQRAIAPKDRPTVPVFHPDELAGLFEEELQAKVQARKAERS